MFSLMLVYKYVMLCETIALSFDSLLVDLLTWWFDFEWDIIHCQLGGMEDSG